MYHPYELLFFSIKTGSFVMINQMAIFNGGEYRKLPAYKITA